MSDESTQPAIEHHVGTLDLSGEGNAPAADPSQLAQAALFAHMREWHEDGTVTCQGCGYADDQPYGWPQHQAAVALEAAYPAIRQQVAEEIAVAIAVRRDEITPGRPGWVYLTEAIRITREIGGRGGNAIPPGSTGGVSGRTGLSASPGVERNDL